MILAAMAVAAVQSTRLEQAVYARDARLARFGALVTDMILFGLISFVVNSVYGVTHVDTGPSLTIGGGTYTTSVAWPFLTLLGILYFTIPEAMFGATPGKFWMRLKVVRLDGTPLELPSVIVRNLLKPIDWLPLLYVLGGLFLLWTAGSQRLGDLAAGTTVVYQHRAANPGATRSAGRSARLALAGLLAAAVVFTIAFNYFGRPPLVIEGDFNQHTMFGRDVTSYSLGSPTWGFGQVTYPITLSTPTAICAGAFVLRWSFLGWDPVQASYSCLS